MYKPSFLKLKSKYYILLLGIIHILGFTFLSGCTSSGNNNNRNNTTDSFKRIKEVNDSINKEKHKKDSIATIKKNQDSIVRIDSINKANKNNYNPAPPKCMYGAPPNFNKK